MLASELQVRRGGAFQASCCVRAVPRLGGARLAALLPGADGALGRRGAGAPAVRALETDERPTASVDNIALRSIEGLDTDYCNDFECTSSPAVEQTVRSLARELQRARSVHAQPATARPAREREGGHRPAVVGWHPLLPLLRPHKYGGRCMAAVAPAIWVGVGVGLRCGGGCSRFGP